MNKEIIRGLVALAMCTLVAGYASTGYHKDSLNRKIASIVRDALARGCEKNGAEVGWAVVQNARTGEILCTESKSTCSHNRVEHFPKPWEDSTLELGGLVLPFMVASALDTGVFSPDDSVDVSEETVGGVAIRDIPHSGHARLALEEIVKWSSNRGGAQLADSRRLGLHVALPLHVRWLFSSGRGFLHGPRCL